MQLLPVPAHATALLVVAWVNVALADRANRVQIIGFDGKEHHYRHEAHHHHIHHRHDHVHDVEAQAVHGRHHGHDHQHRHSGPRRMLNGGEVHHGDDSQDLSPELCVRLHDDKAVRGKCVHFMARRCGHLRGRATAVAAGNASVDPCQAFFLAEERAKAASITSAEPADAEEKEEREEKEEEKKKEEKKEKEEGEEKGEKKEKEEKDKKETEAESDGEKTKGLFNKKDESQPMPEQGVSGPLVAHDDLKTVTADWRKEYGKHHRTYQEICADHPDNLWCRRHGYTRSSARCLLRPSLSLALAAVAVVVGQP